MSTDGAQRTADLLYHLSMTDLLDDPALSPDPSAAHLAALNEAQCRAVAAVDGAVLVLAGAGTRKTRALTTRLPRIPGTGAAYPRQIPAGTLPNKAAPRIQGRP